MVTANNRPGLLKLPNETIFEILSYFPEINLSGSTNARSRNEFYFYDPSYDSPEHIREDALRALSRTSRETREFFLPLLWKRFSVYTRDGEAVWYRRVSKELEVRSLFVTQPENKHLAQYIQTCHIVLTRCSTDTVLPAFARALKAISNLHTLEILHAHSQMTTALKEHFEKRTYPSIKTIILPSCAHNILRCCPEVTSVTCTEEDGSKLISAIIAKCPKVEVLKGVSLKKGMTKRLMKAVPNLHVLGISSRGLSIDADNIRGLKSLKHLHSLAFDINALQDQPPTIDIFQKKSPIIAAKEVLRSTPGPRDKQLQVVWHWQVVPDFYNSQWEATVLDIPIF